MQNHYADSWLFYKLHSERFVDDFEYYLEFTKNYSALELFAGYGRLTNYLHDNGINIESVELEENFAKFISLPAEKNHVENVLSFKPDKKYERIIAGYNSFCLFIHDDDIRTFFSNLSAWLTPGGKASLSYYHPDFWLQHSGAESQFNHNGQVIRHISRPDLSRRTEKVGMWVDEYIHAAGNIAFNYPTKIYENKNCIVPYLAGTGLELVDVVLDYNMENMRKKGWLEFVVKKLAA